MTTFTIHRLHLPLVRPFRTSFGTETVRDVLLVSAQLPDGTVGWGECSTMSWPGYSAEYSEGAVDVMTRHLIPALANVGIDPSEVTGALEVVRGHPMAKSAIKTALLDAWLRTQNRSLAEYLGAVRDRVDCGVSVGIPNSLPELLDEVAEYVDLGYRRIKLKIEPGWDLDPVEAVRTRWPEIPLQVDANQAYSRVDIAHLQHLDPFDLLLIEQPLHEDDLVGHVRLAEAMSTPICLDESIISLATAEAALDFGAASIINIKPGRIGGYLTARQIHDLCLERNVPVWCGGMLETGLGRAANVALAALPGFTLPGDTSGSDRYYRTDITEPFVLQDGQLAVPTGPGIGVQPIPEILEDFTVWRSEPIAPVPK